MWGVAIWFGFEGLELKKQLGVSEFKASGHILRVYGNLEAPYKCPLYLKLTASWISCY